MNLVTDRELVLYHYGDGLDADRAGQIEEALAFDAELRLRLADLRESLSIIAADWPADQAASDLEQRLWRRLEPQLAPRQVRTSLARRWLDWIEPLRPAPVVFASLLVAALGVGYLVGRRDVPSSPPALAASPLLAEDASHRVLAAYLVTHLQDTERALLVASRSPEDGEAAQQLAAALLDSHRLYALAAERAGKPQLAAFLRELEPVLIELSNEQGTVSPALGAAIVDRDLAYKSRAAAALARNELAAAPLSL
jgi:hypothetical protein